MFFIVVFFIIAAIITVIAVYYNLGQKLKDVENDFAKLEDADVEFRRNPSDEASVRKLAKAKTEYNHSAEDFNNSTDTFPGIIFGKMEKFAHKPLVEISAEDKANVTGPRSLNL